MKRHQLDRLRGLVVDRRDQVDAYVRDSKVPRDTHAENNLMRWKSESAELSELLGVLGYFESAGTINLYPDDPDGGGE